MTNLHLRCYNWRENVVKINFHSTSIYKIKGKTFQEKLNIKSNGKFKIFKRLFFSNTCNRNSELQNLTCPLFKVINLMESQAHIVGILL